jgi:hypothetical protein
MSHRLNPVIVDSYHSGGTDVLLCLFCVLSCADKEPATGRPFVQAVTSNAYSEDSENRKTSKSRAVLSYSATEMKTDAAF